MRPVARVEPLRRALVGGDIVGAQRQRIRSLAITGIDRQTQCPQLGFLPAIWAEMHDHRQPGGLQIPQPGDQRGALTPFQLAAGRGEVERICLPSKKT